MTSHGSQGPGQRLMNIDMLPQDSLELKDITHISSPLLDLKFTITRDHKACDTSMSKSFWQIVNTCIFDCSAWIGLYKLSQPGLSRCEDIAVVKICTATPSLCRAFMLSLVALLNSLSTASS